MKSSSVLRRMDHTEIDSRFSNEHAIKYEELSNFSVSYDEISPFLSKLPPREIDLIELYYKDRKNQKDIAKMFGVTQGAISSRLSRAKIRLSFLRSLPKITDEEIDRDLCSLFDTMELEIIKYMMATTCQSKTAQLINEKYGLVDTKQRMTQVKVRHRFEKCLHLLEKEVEKDVCWKRYFSLLKLIKTNLYKLHEVRLPHFDRGNFAVISIYS